MTVETVLAEPGPGVLPPGAGHSRTALPELRGHGDSDRPAQGHGLEDHLGALLALVDAPGLDRFAITGQATGATLGLFLATRLPGRVTARAPGTVAPGIRPPVNALVQAQVAA